MKNLLLMIAVAAFAIAGAAQKEQPKKSDAKKTVAVKKTPTPAKKTTTAAKKPVDKKTPEKQTAGDKKKPAAKPATAPKKTISETSQTTASKTPAKAVPKPTPVKKDPKADLEKALAIEKPEEKITALTKFLADNPRSDLRPRAAESLTAARVAAGESKFEADERDNALNLFRLAVQEAPVPYPEKLFSEIISKVPANLYFRGEQAAAIEAAAVIEKNSASSVPQLIALANFYLSTENAADAKRLAEAVLKLDEKSAAAHQLIGMANRMNFDLEASAADFAKALELDPESVSAQRRGLADINRALGKPDEAIRLYNELIANDADDLPAQTGRILSLFNAGKRTEAETEFSKSIEANPSNIILLAGAAYWYAANGDNAKAIDLAGKAIAAEPRFIWSHIALGRALTADGRFSDAEQALLRARKYGNFPTLEYEIASARFAGGLYREAAEELQKSFAIKDGMVSAKLGRRVERSEKSFTDSLSFERRASILEPKSADRVADADALKALLELKLLLAEPSPDAAKAAELADAFAKGSDKMRFHRQLFVAGELLDKKTAPAKAFEIARAAITSVDDGLNIPAPAGPIMANELYASRVAAINVDKFILIPDVPKQTLSAIARGRIEEIAGWSLLQQGNNAEAAVRLRRAVSILPEKSAWWRTSLWRLGSALEADGKDKEALDTYVKNYQSSDADAGKYASIETIYKRVNGSTDGLDALIGANPAKPVETPVEIKAPESDETKAPEKEEKKESVPTPVESKTSSDEKTTEKPQPSDTKPPETKVEEKKESVPATEETKPITDEKVIEKPETSDAKPPETKAEEKKESVPAIDETKPITDEKAIEKPQPSETKQVVTDPTENKPVETKIEEEKKEPVPVTVETEPVPDEKTTEKQQPTETKPPEVKNSETKKSVEKSEPTDSKPSETKIDENKDAAKALFEPVIIEIKKSQPVRPKKDQDAASEQPNSSETGDEQTPNRRPRVVEGKVVKAEVEQPQCTISVSQETVSLIGGGGSIGLLVKIENGDLKELTAASSSPKDVEIVLDSEPATGQTRALYVVRSLTPAIGVYQVSFAAPCGKKEVTVKIR